MNFKKSVIGLILLSFLSALGLMLMMEPVRAYANENEVTATQSETEESLMPDTLFEDVDNPYDLGLPEVTIDDANQWIERKGFEIIGLLQKFAQPFTIATLIISGLMIVVGAFGNSKLFSRGIIGTCTSLIIYATILYAPEIMDFFLNFVKS